MPALHLGEDITIATRKQVPTRIHGVLIFWFGGNAKVGCSAGVIGFLPKALPGVRKWPYHNQLVTRHPLFKGGRCHMAFQHRLSNRGSIPRQANKDMIP